MELRGTARTIWQAQGVLMEVFGLDATEAWSWLMRTATQRGAAFVAVAADVIDHRQI